MGDVRLGHGGLCGSGPEHEAFGELVGRETVCPVHFRARALAGRVQAREFGAPKERTTTDPPRSCSALGTDLRTRAPCLTSAFVVLLSVA